MVLTEFRVETIDFDGILTSLANTKSSSPAGKLTIELYWHKQLHMAIQAFIEGVDGSHIVIRAKSCQAPIPMTINRLVLRSNGAIKSDKPPPKGIMTLNEGDSIVVGWRWPMEWPL